MELIFTIASESDTLYKAGITVYSYGWSNRGIDQDGLKYSSSHPHVQWQQWSFIDEIKLQALSSSLATLLCRNQLRELALLALDTTCHHDVTLAKVP